jgi:replication initiator protein A
MNLTLSEWFYEGILMDGGLLSIDPVYFSITGGRERWLYRVARKHAGGAGPNGFVISLPVLFEKSGAEGPYRRFKFEMQAIVRDDNLPQFTLELEYGKGEPLLCMKRRELLPAVSPYERRSTPGSHDLPTAAPTSPALPLFELPALSTDALARIRRDFPGWDLQELQTEFDAWIAGNRERVPANYEAAFYGFVRHHHARRSQA